VLLAWLQGGIAPQFDIIPQSLINQLAALDAVVVTDSGLGCYPFSAIKTEIEVEFGGQGATASNGNAIQVRNNTTMCREGCAIQRVA
jgi:hypothetical protein